MSSKLVRSFTITIIIMLCKILSNVIFPRKNKYVLRAEQSR